VAVDHVRVIHDGSLVVRVVFSSLGALFDSTLKVFSGDDTLTKKIVVKAEALSLVGGPDSLSVFIFNHEESWVWHNSFEWSFSLTSGIVRPDLFVVNCLKREATIFEEPKDFVLSFALSFCGPDNFVASFSAESFKDDIAIF